MKKGSTFYLTKDFGFFFVSFFGAWLLLCESNTVKSLNFFNFNFSRVQVFRLVQVLSFYRFPSFTSSRANFSSFLYASKTKAKKIREKWKQHDTSTTRLSLHLNCMNKIESSMCISQPFYNFHFQINIISTIIWNNAGTFLESGRRRSQTTRTREENKGNKRMTFSSFFRFSLCSD